MNNNYWQNEYKKQLSFLNKADVIILYGNSVIAPIIKVALEELNINVPKIVFDRGNFIGDMDINDIHNEVIVLCGLRKKTLNSMEKDVVKYFPNAICFDFFAIYYIWLTEVIKRDCNYEVLSETIYKSCQEDNIVFNIDMINTSYCNLSCQNCSNGMQIRCNKKNIPLEVQTQSIEKITNIIPIYNCNIQGGEPLLCNNLDETILQLAKNPKIALLSLATNGKIIPSDSVMRALAKTGTMIRISDYGELSDKIADIERKAIEFGVPCYIYPRAEVWVSYGKLEKNNRNIYENKNIADKCFFGTKDIMLYDNKLYCCCRTLYADAMGLDTKEMKYNTLDLRSDISKKELQDIVNGENLYLMCDYCDYPMEKVVPGQQLEK